MCLYFICEREVIGISTVGSMSEIKVLKIPIQSDIKDHDHYRSIADQSYTLKCTYLLCKYSQIYL